MTKNPTEGSENNGLRLGRRAFIQNGTLLLAASSTSKSLLAQESDSKLRIGLVTDLHFADKDPARSRHYRESFDKLTEATKKFTEDQADFVVNLGDLIDAADSVELELEYLKRINGVLADLSVDKHYVLGNHCVATLTKQEFLKGVGQEKPHYSFDVGQFHFVVLDACFLSNGDAYERGNAKWDDSNMPVEQLRWLEEDLQQTSKKTVVFAHQRLDVDNDYAIKNAPDIRKVLEQSGNVLAVFQGHSHENEYNEISGIHYCTLVAMVEGSGVENNGYSLLEISSDGAIQLSGFRNQSDYRWEV